ncbi:ADP-ribosylglycohydrolase family protein [Staphylospora marina]|uniref:ADP-ribosylglycohydrolase family protein n=1 Tax=Staphylospora marina TaxID=2490858 RepID=UPI0013DE5069|nr:ADP-ribosylglycohydrolase family protein [Staphylospora marina]
MIEERKRGALLGLAWGDVLGCPVEGWRDREIREAYGTYDRLPETYPLERIPEKRKKKLRPPGLHSDDTQQAMGLVLTVLSGGWSLDRWTRLLVDGWKRQAWRGVGRNFTAAVHRLAKGEEARRSGSPSAGIGAAMRTGPLGALISDPETRLTVALESSLSTHSDQRAAVFAAVVAEAVSLFIGGKTPSEVPGLLSSFARKAEERVMQWKEAGWNVENADSRQVSDALGGLASAIGDEPEEVRRLISDSARPHLAEGFIRAHPNQGFVLLGGIHALAMACRSDMGPNEVLLSIIREGFDTDTVAAIAGSLLGARFGTDWIPADRLADGERIGRYADALIIGQPFETAEEFFVKEAGWTSMETQYRRQRTSPAAG